MGENFALKKNNKKGAVLTVSSKYMNESNIDKTSITEYLQTVKMEYGFERNKKVSFENRAGIMLTVYGGLALILFEKVKIRSIVDMFNINLTLLKLVNIISGILVYIFFTISLFLLSKIISVDKYRNFEVDQIDEKLMSEDNYIGTARLVLTYKEIILSHRTINEKKATNLKNAIRLILATLLSLMIYLSTI